MLYWIVVILAEILLIGYYIFMGFPIFLIGAIIFLLLMIFKWYMDSRITDQWSEFHTGVWRFQPKYFSGVVKYDFVCNYFEGIESETGIQKVLGFSTGWHHWNSIRLGYRRFGDTLHTVLYFYDHGKRCSINLGVTIKEGDMCSVQWSIENGVLIMVLYNGTTETNQTLKQPVKFKMGLGYQLYNFGAKSSFNIRKG